MALATSFLKCFQEDGLKNKTRLITLLTWMIVLGFSLSVSGEVTKGKEIIIAFTGDTNGKVQPCG